MLPVQVRQRRLGKRYALKPPVDFVAIQRPMHALQSQHALLRVEHLDFSWPQAPLFQDLSFSLSPGVSVLRGDDGSGKTTLLRLLAGERSPDRGSLSLHGEPLHTHPPSSVFWMDPQTQAHDTVSAAAYLHEMARRYPDWRPDVLAALTEGFGLQEHLNKPLYMLSTGSKRKVWLSAAFAAGASLTLIDHPFAALDAPSIRFLKELLREAAEHSTRAWLLADHSLPEGVPLAGVIEL